MLQNYFNFKGRINRKPFWLRNLVLYIAIIVIMGLVFLAIGGSMSSLTDIDFSGGAVIVGGLILGLAVIAFYISAISLSIRRLHDRNKSGWWILIFFAVSAVLGAIGETFKDSDIAQIVVPILTLIISIWFLIEVGFRKGTEGPNKYGPDPISGAVADPEVFGRRDGA